MSRHSSHASDVARSSTSPDQWLGGSFALSGSIELQTNFEDDGAPPQPKQLLDRVRGTLTGFPRRCARCFDSHLVIGAMMVATIYALLGDDVRLAATSVDADTVFLGLSLATLVLFTGEFASFCFGKTGYLLSFFFWLDLIALLSLLPDIAFVWRPLLRSLSWDVADSPIVVGDDDARDVARLGQLFVVVRLIRLLRVVKLYRYILDQFCGVDAADHDGADHDGADNYDGAAAQGDGGALSSNRRGSGMSYGSDAGGSVNDSRRGSARRGSVGANRNFDIGSALARFHRMRRTSSMPNLAAVATTTTTTTTTGGGGGASTVNTAADVDVTSAVVQRKSGRRLGGTNNNNISTNDGGVAADSKEVSSSASAVPAPSESEALTALSSAATAAVLDPANPPQTNWDAMLAAKTKNAPAPPPPPPSTAARHARRASDGRVHTPTRKRRA
jgi:hypothetical protein